MFGTKPKLNLIYLVSNVESYGKLCAFLPEIKGFINLKMKNYTIKINTYSSETQNPLHPL